MYMQTWREVDQQTALNSTVPDSPGLMFTRRSKEKNGSDQLRGLTRLLLPPHHQTSTP